MKVLAGDAGENMDSSNLDDILTNGQDHLELFDFEKVQARVFVKYNGQL